MRWRGDGDGYRGLGDRKKFRVPGQGMRARSGAGRDSGRGSDGEEKRVREGQGKWGGEKECGWTTG